MGPGGNRRETGARRKGQVFIGVWVPPSMAKAVNKVLENSKLNRSKFLRQALEEKLKRRSK